MKRDNVIKLDKKLKKSNGDLVLLLITAFLIIFGIIAVFSSSYYYALEKQGTPYYFLKRHLVMVGIGIVLSIIASLIDYHLYKYLWKAAYIIGLLLLVAVLIPGIGSSVADAVRWIKIGPVTIMPGEWAKFCIVISTAGYLNKKKDNGNVSFKDFAFVMGHAVVYVGLILKEPNLSTAIIVVGIPFIMLFISGARIKYLLGSVGIVGCGAGLFAIAKPYIVKRITSFINPFASEALYKGDGWNGAQSLIALGTGGLFGKGIGNSVQKNLYLPMPYNDFILAIIGEETGFFGILLLMAAFSLLIYRGILIAIKAKDFEGTMLACGFVSWIAIQVILHFAVVTSTMPATGVVLPFISYGGNATILAIASIGILFNISKKTSLKEQGR